MGHCNPWPHGWFSVKRPKHIKEWQQVESGNENFQWARIKSTDLNPSIKTNYCLEQYCGLWSKERGMSRYRMHIYIDTCTDTLIPIHIPILYFYIVPVWQCERILQLPQTNEHWALMFWAEISQSMSSTTQAPSVDLLVPKCLSSRCPQPFLSSSLSSILSHTRVEGIIS